MSTNDEIEFETLIDTRLPLPQIYLLVRKKREHRFHFDEPVQMRNKDVGIIPCPPSVRSGVPDGWQFGRVSLDHASRETVLYQMVDLKDIPGVLDFREDSRTMLS